MNTRDFIDPEHYYCSTINFYEHGRKMPPLNKIKQEFYLVMVKQEVDPFEEFLDTLVSIERLLK